MNIGVIWDCLFELVSSLGAARYCLDMIKSRNMSRREQSIQDTITDKHL